MTAQLLRLDPTPAFLRGSVSLMGPPSEGVRASTEAERSGADAESRGRATCAVDPGAMGEWLVYFVDRWRQRPGASIHDLVVLVGSPDRLIVSPRFEQHVATNAGLARGRAEWVATELRDATSALAARDRLDTHRILVLTRGPRPGVGENSDRDCTDPELAEDRRVEVWIQQAHESAGR